MIKKEIESNKHPLEQFHYCPKCGSSQFVINDNKSKRCEHCGFVYYFNPSSAVTCIIRNDKGQILIAKRKMNPGKGQLDLPGGFVDCFETGEEAAIREIKEECNLLIQKPKYLFSFPNLYPYSGFVTHTLDMFYECIVANNETVIPMDDVDELYFMNIKDIKLDDFAFQSIRNGLAKYIEEIQYPRSPKSINPE